MSAYVRSRANTYSNLSLDREGECRDRDADLAQRAHAPGSRFIVLRNDGRALVDPDSHVFLLEIFQPVNQENCRDLAGLSGSFGSRLEK